MTIQRQRQRFSVSVFYHLMIFNKNEDLLI